MKWFSGTKGTSLKEVIEMSSLEQRLWKLGYEYTEPIRENNSDLDRVPQLLQDLRLTVNN